MVLRHGSIVAVALIVCACGGKESEAGSGGYPGSQSPDSSPSSFGAPAAIAQHILSPPMILVSDGSSLFWIDSNDDIWSVPASGGQPAQLAADAAYNWSLLYLDSSSLYFVGREGITVLPKAGGDLSTIVAISADHAAIGAAAVYSGTVYWTEQVLDGSQMITVQSAPLGGGATLTLGSVNSAAPPIALAATATIVVVPADRALEGLPVGGGIAAALGSGLNCEALLSNGSSVYCGGSSGPLVLVEPDGTTTEIASETSGAQALALDVTNIYWINDASAGSVMTAPRQGGPAVTVAYDDAPTTIAVDDTAVYWSDEAGNLQRAAKQ